MKKLKLILSVILILYLILLIPECSNNKIEVAAKSQFVWNQDSLWNSLEKLFISSKNEGCDNLNDEIKKSLTLFSSTIDSLKLFPIKPIDPIINRIEELLFTSAALIGACPDSAQIYFNLVEQLRYNIKKQSRTWDINDMTAKQSLYRIIYGGRAAVEELLLQHDKSILPPIGNLLDDNPSNHSVEVFGIKIHSGDILISRGGAPVSALISRGNDFPGNFSHVALVHINPESKKLSILESHIERGVTISSLEDYLNDKKLRIMVLRIRPDLQQIINNPLIPHLAAEMSFNRAAKEHIPYDFEMNFKDDSKLFCSEVASSVYSQYGINLWMGLSTISSYGTAKLLSGFGVENFETQEPSDLEYDPQLNVIAEWRDYETLMNDHIDNAVVDAILEYIEEGNEIGSSWYKLPLVRLVKLYSLILNIFGNEGIVPEGMSASSALRHESFVDFHTKIKNKLLLKVATFKKEKGYVSPYWKILKFARVSLSEVVGEK